MLDIMYEVPSNEKINKVIITKDSVLGKESPRLEEGERKKPALDSEKSLKDKNIENAS